MAQRKSCKCCHCQNLFNPDYRNRGRQKFCAAPACRQASKAASQHAWLDGKGRDYFLGEANRLRVQEWRKLHPGYWRKSRPQPKAPLQDPCPPDNTAQVFAAPGVIHAPGGQDALQDLCQTLIACQIGLAAHLAGGLEDSLQDSIANSLAKFIKVGSRLLEQGFLVYPMLRGDLHVPKGKRPLNYTPLPDRWRWPRPAGGREAAALRRAQAWSFDGWGWLFEGAAT